MQDVLRDALYRLMLLVEETLIENALVTLFFNLDRNYLFKLRVEVTVDDRLATTAQYSMLLEAAKLQSIRWVIVHLILLIRV